MTQRKNWLQRLSGWFLRPSGQQAPQKAAAGARRHKAVDGASPPSPPKSGKLKAVASEDGLLGQTRMRQRVSRAFGASQPVQERQGLCGRDRKLSELLDGVRFRHNHAVICGPRGSGKTSLARVFGDYADEDGAVVLYMAGSDDASFDELLRPYLKQIPEACCSPGVKQEIMVALEREKLTASSVVDLLTAIRYSQVIFIFDEFDRITSPEAKAELTTLMKLTSDACLKVNYVVVGIAENLHELITAHASLRRHLTIVSVEPLADEAIGRILSDCFEKSGLQCDDKAAAMLTAAACGSPYHARLFGMHAALQAISERERLVQRRHVRDGLRGAFNEWRAGNPEDAAIFEQIASTGAEERSQIVRLASHAAYRHAGSPPSGAIPREEPIDPPPALRPSLETAESFPIFRDSLAPQFLLIAMEMGGVAPPDHRMEAVE